MAFNLSSLTSFLKADITHPSSSEGVLGIDIGSSTVKIVQLNDVKGVPTLKTYGELQLGPYEGVDIGRTTHLPTQKAIEALVDILREAGATGKDAAFALSYSSSFMGTILIPTLDPEQVASMIPIEARKYVPTSLTRVTLDWIVLGIHEKEKVTSVLLSAIYNESMAKYESIMNGGGLAVAASEIEIFSSIRSIVSPKDETVAVLDFGASSTRLYIVERGVVKKTHSVPLSGVELTRTLETTMHIEFEDAEELKRAVGLHGKAEDPRIQKALLNAIERGLREVHTVIARFTESEKVAIQKVIVTGGGALLKGIVPYISDMFSLQVETANPFSKVAYPAFLEDTLKDAGPSFAVAVGVALRAFQNRKS